jgi:predicted MFS family arabinose efflux permease
VRRTADTGDSDTGGTQRHDVAASRIWNRHENFDKADNVKAATWRLTGAATALTALISGSRASFGIFLSPLNTATGLGMASIALAVAFGQLAAGVALPVVEALARRFGPARVIAGGACLLAASTALLIFVHSLIALVFLMLVVFAAGTAVASNALLIGEVSKRVGAGERGVASGVIGAGGPAGQLLLAPIVTAAIATEGWVAAMCALGAIALLALPLARSFAARPATAAPAHCLVGSAESFRDVRFWLIAGSFAFCGFHVAFLAVHMPGVIEQCGLSASFTGIWLVVAGAANMAGSLGIGVLMKRFASAPLLALVYGLRVASILVFLWLPTSGGVLLAFALAMGLTYTATMPPTAELIARSFGVERLSGLLGAAMLLHQVGGFFGAWLGGVAVEHSGGYVPLWITDVALAAIATGLQLVLVRIMAAPRQRRFALGAPSVSRATA